MRVLWAPWRLAYVEKKTASDGCLFCDKPRLSSAKERREALVLHTTERASVIMNRFPYANAHLMVAPLVHTADFAAMHHDLAAALQAELIFAVSVLERAYSPSGFNIGMNLGECAGAGIADHLHWHVVPRWMGDTNFMPLFADTRVIPQHIEETYDRLLPFFEEDAS